MMKLEWWLLSFIDITFRYMIPGLSVTITLLAFFLNYHKKKKLEYVHTFSSEIHVIKDHDYKTAGDDRVILQTRLVFWNPTRQIICKEDIPKSNPIVISCVKGAELYGVSLLSASNEGSGVKIVKNRRGDYQIKFEYLEAGDGFLIEVLSSGTCQDDLLIKGSIRGSGKKAIKYCSVLERERYLSIRELLNNRSIFFIMTFILTIIVLIGTFIPFDVTFHLGDISKSAKWIHIPSELKPISLGFIIGLWIFLLLTTKSGISIRKRLPKELLKYGSINNKPM
ncbi:MAG TPA: hypothetical protein VHT96_13905 [Clostridia bacterium]|nr:hypothetical protein [Clostridia bacterium]